MDTHSNAYLDAIMAKATESLPAFEEEIVKPLGNASGNASCNVPGSPAQRQAVLELERAGLHHPERVSANQEVKRLQSHQQWRPSQLAFAPLHPAEQICRPSRRP